MTLTSNNQFLDPIGANCDTCPYCTTVAAAGTSATTNCRKHYGTTNCSLGSDVARLERQHAALTTQVATLLNQVAQLNAQADQDQAVLAAMTTQRNAALTDVSDLVKALSPLFDTMKKQGHKMVECKE